MLIENDKRGSKFAVPLTYKPDSRFYVPHNVFIIGMMNTADYSLAMIDKNGTLGNWEYDRTGITRNNNKVIVKS